MSVGSSAVLICAVLCGRCRVNAYTHFPIICGRPPNTTTPPAIHRMHVRRRSRLHKYALLRVHRRLASLMGGVCVCVGTHTHSHSYAQRDWICVHTVMYVSYTHLLNGKHICRCRRRRRSLACPKLLAGARNILLRAAECSACVYVALAERARERARNNTMVRRVYHHMSPNVVSKNASNAGCE